MKVYRIQPAGLQLDHRSEDSAGESLHLHVFPSIEATIGCEGKPTDYGDEVIEIETLRSWDNGDVEGVAIDGSRSQITARYTLSEFAAIACPKAKELTAVELEVVPAAYAACPLWYAARQPKNFW